MKSDLIVDFLVPFERFCSSTCGQKDAAETCRAPKKRADQEKISCYYNYNIEFILFRPFLKQKIRIWTAGCQFKDVSLGSGKFWVFFVETKKINCENELVLKS